MDNFKNDIPNYNISFNSENIEYGINEIFSTFRYINKRMNKVEFFENFIEIRENNC